MDGDFGDDVGVETVAEVNGVDVVAARTRDTLAIVAPTTRRARQAGNSGHDVAERSARQTALQCSVCRPLLQYRTADDDAADAAARRARTIPDRCT